MIHSSCLDPVNFRQLQPLAHKSLQQINQSIIEVIVTLHAKIEHLPEQLLASAPRE